MAAPLDDFDFDNFWDPCDYATETYTGENLSDAMVAKIERELGYLSLIHI